MENIIEAITAIAPFLQSYSPWVKALVVAWVMLSAILLVTLVLNSPIPKEEKKLTEAETQDNSQNGTKSLEASAINPVPNSNTSTSGNIVQFKGDGNGAIIAGGNVILNKKDLLSGLPEFRLNAEMSGDGTGTINYLRFSLSNTGGGLIEVTRIEVIAEFEECTELHPETKAAITQSYDYELTLEPSMQTYMIEDRSFNYKKNDIDHFAVKLTSTDHGNYVIVARVHYKDVVTGAKSQIDSKKFKIHIFTVNSQKFIDKISSQIGQNGAANNNDNHKRYDFYMMAIKTDNFLSMAHENVSVTLFNRGDYKKALGAVNKAIDLLPNSPSGWYNKGLTEIKLDMTKEAIRSFQQLVSIHPNSKRGWHYLGLLLYREKRLEEALIAFRNSQSIEEVNSVEFMRSPEFHRRGEAFWNIKPEPPISLSIGASPADK